MTDTPTLSGQLVELRPLGSVGAEQLLAAAADGELWNLKVTNVPGPDTVGAYLAKAFEGERAGTVMPFAIVHRETGRVVGSTRFWKIDRANRKLEIGHTWLGASMQRSGATQEGIVRHERIMPDGRKRDSVRFSIIDDEWPATRQHLERLLAKA